MKNIVVMLLFAGIVFGASAAGSMYLRQKGHAAAADGEQPAENAAGDAQHAKPGSSAAATGDQQTLGKGPDEAPAGVRNDLPADKSGLPAAVRSSPVSVEELLKYSLGLKSREERIIDREKEIERKQAQASIIQTDIHGEQQALDGMRTQIREELQSIERMLSQVGEERQKFEAEKAKSEESLKDLRTFQDESKTSEAANIKQLSVWFQSMDPEKAATVINQLAKDGKIDLAVQMLSNFDDREAAKILGAIEDTTLTVDLATAFREYRKPVKKPEKRR